MSSSSSQEQAPKQTMMDPIQYERMLNQMKADLRKYKEDLEKEQREKAELEKKRQEESERMQELQKNWELAKAEKRRGLSQIVDQKVKPFLETLKKDQDPSLVNNLNMFEDTINQGLDNAFMDPAQMALFQTVEAAASQMANTNAQLAAKSSELEKLFQSDKEWREKFESLQKQKAELEEKTAAEIKAAREEKELKEKMLEDFKKEIEQLKALKAQNMMDTENMIENTSAMEDVTTTDSSSTPTPQQSTVEATASNNANAGGYNTLYMFNGYKPRTDWRSVRRNGW